MKKAYFYIIGAAIMLVAIILVVAFFVADNGLGMGLSLVFGLMASGILRFLDEMWGE